MILADKIVENRKKNGWSQEELAEKLGVSRQSVSKWESAQAVPDLKKILQLSELFGVTTDYLVKDELEEAPAQEVAPVDNGIEETTRTVTMEEAASFLKYNETASRMISTGVMICILSPVPLILLGALAEQGRIPLEVAVAEVAGTAILLFMVAAAVGIFVREGMSGKRYEYLENVDIDTEYGVDGMVRDRREKYRQSYSIQLVIGIVMCVLSAIPLFLAMLVFGENDVASAVSVGAILVLIAAGVFLIVRCSTVWGSFQILLQEGDYTPERKAEAPKYARIATIYWCSATALFLALSFLTKAWDRTWIVWPVAGVAYGVVIAIAASLRKKG
jgi:transcriptional regulator with XRE-family HTH domain